MAPTLNREIGLRREGSREVSPPAVLPEGLESPLSDVLPRTVAGKQRRRPLLSAVPLRSRRIDWADLGMLGLVLTSAALSVYRLFWAIQN